MIPLHPNDPKSDYRRIKFLCILVLDKLYAQGVRSTTADYKTVNDLLAEMRAYSELNDFSDIKQRFTAWHNVLNPIIVKHCLSINAEVIEKTTQHYCNRAIHA